MAEKTFSLSSIHVSSTSPLLHHLTYLRRNPKFLRRYPIRPTLIVCKSTQQHATNQNSSPKSPIQLSASPPEPEGLGAAAPTPGEMFIQHQKSRDASALGLASTKKKKKKKEKVLKVSAVMPTCYGCGAPLQTSEADAPGYVEPEAYELKKKHHQLRQLICGRCRLLSHGHMVTAVGGNGGYSGGKQFVSAEELREKLSHLKHEKALIVKLIDIVDFNGSFLARVRDIAGSNPIILVVTKVDLLPKGTDLNCVGDWVVEATVKKKLNVLSVHLTSSKSLVGIAGVISEIQKAKKGRDVYILGAANVGKSAFINALLKMMSYKDPVAAAAQKYKPIQSAVPGTTLGPIQIDAFLGGGKLYDTPGVHLHHRQAAVVNSEDLPTLAPKSRLKGQCLPNRRMESLVTAKVQSSGLNGFSIFWGGLVRIDVVKALVESSLTFYGPKALQIHMVPTEKADEFYQKEIGTLLTPPTGKERAANWMGLEAQRQLHISFDVAERPACDVSISGLGWFAVEPVNRAVGTSDSNPEETARELILSVHVPKPVEIFIRPPLPVGKAGEEWYQYRELTEKEEEVRPKWHY